MNTRTGRGGLRGRHSDHEGYRGRQQSSLDAAERTAFLSPCFYGEEDSCVVFFCERKSLRLGGREIQAACFAHGNRLDREYLLDRLTDRVTLKSITDGLMLLADHENDLFVWGPAGGDRRPHRAWSPLSFRCLHCRGTARRLQDNTAFFLRSR